MEGLKKNRNEVDSVLVNQALLISVAAAISNSFLKKYGFLFWIAPQLFNFINYFFIHFFIFQLRSEIGCLQEELKGKRAEMETLDTLLQRRERESQEGGNLLKMLTDDLQSVKQEK